MSQVKDQSAKVTGAKSQGQINTKESSVGQGRIKLFRNKQKYGGKIGSDFN